jgi:hypothetical protein
VVVDGVDVGGDVEEVEIEDVVGCG